jgi:hypothetical protein
MSYWQRRQINDTISVQVIKYSFYGGILGT